MALYAKLADDNTVLDVTIVADADCLGEDRNISEDAGRQFLEGLTGHAKWKMYDQNGAMRARPARIGSHYCPQHDVFTLMPIEDGMIWSVDEQDYIWEIPTGLIANIMEIVPIETGETDGATG